MQSHRQENVNSFGEPDLEPPMTEPIRLTGQAIVTGAAQGIGAAVAKRLAADGYQLVLADHNESVVERAREICASGRSATAVVGDIADEHHVSELVATAENRGGVEVLVNNAGYLAQSPFQEIAVSDWDRMIAVHLRGAFLCCSAVVPHMIRRGGGRIVNVASQLAQKGGFELAHYAAAKAGVIGLTKSLALELSDRNVRVNAVAPGPINTAMIQATSAEWRRRKLGELPLGAFGEPEDIAETVAFLVSPASRLYVGQTLNPNSGDIML